MKRQGREDWFETGVFLYHEVGTGRNLLFSRTCLLEAVHLALPIKKPMWFYDMGLYRFPIHLLWNTKVSALLSCGLLSSANHPRILRS